MRIIGYSSERLAANYCPACAAKRWDSTALARGTETDWRAAYATPTNPDGERTFNIHPIFSTDDTQDNYCDDCCEGIE